MQVLSISGNTALCTRQGVSREVDVYLLQDQDIAIGDYVLVHVGYAIQTIDPKEARLRERLFEKMQSMESN